MKRIYLTALAVVLLYIAVAATWNRHASAQVVTFDTGQVSCAGTVTSLVSASQQRTGLLLTNPGTVAVYIGNASVATNTGAYLPGGGSLSLPTKAAVSCISSGASQTVTYIETYNTF
jgi:hypothetical protein